MEIRKVTITSVNSKELRLPSEEDTRVLRPMKTMAYVSVVKCPDIGQMAIVDRCARCNRFLRISDSGENVVVECKA